MNDYRKNKKKVKVTIRLSGKELGLCEDYLLLGASCKEHKFVDSPLYCEKCENAKRKTTSQIQDAITGPIWRAYLKKTEPTLFHKLSKKEKAFLKMIKSKPKDTELYENAMIKVATQYGLNKKQAKDSIEKFMFLGEIFRPKKGIIDTTTKLPTRKKNKNERIIL